MLGSIEGIPQHSPICVNLTVSDCDYHRVVLLAQARCCDFSWTDLARHLTSRILQPVQCADTAVLETTSYGHHTGWVWSEKKRGHFFRKRKLIQKNARINNIAGSEKCVLSCLQLGLFPGYCGNNELNRVMTSTLGKRFYYRFWKKVTKPSRYFAECFLKAKYGWDVHLKLDILLTSAFSSRGYYASVLN